MSTPAQSCTLEANSQTLKQAHNCINSQPISELKTSKQNKTKQNKTKRNKPMFTPHTDTQTYKHTSTYLFLNECMKHQLGWAIHIEVVGIRSGTTGP
jgi:hypothetical protein